jgi:hypothetical protein
MLLPISEAALGVLREAAKRRGDEAPDTPVFPGRAGKAQLSNLSLMMLLPLMNRSDLTADGFRSAFRDWAAENTKCPRESAEATLAQPLKDNTEAVCQRGNPLDK